jgi:hypothetical protein
MQGNKDKNKEHKNCLLQLVGGEKIWIEMPKYSL